jgi:hypothetical protein
MDALSVALTLKVDVFTSCVVGSVASERAARAQADHEVGLGMRKTIAAV